MFYWWFGITSKKEDTPGLYLRPRYTFLYLKLTQIWQGNSLDTYECDLQNRKHIFIDFHDTHTDMKWKCVERIDCTRERIGRYCHQFKENPKNKHRNIEKGYLNVQLAEKFILLQCDRGSKWTGTR